jgi:leucyl-tRNA synthetase
LHPMWFDTFWLWTEQYAIDHKMKPQVVAKQNIDTYIKQLENIWFTYDWDRSFSTADPEYYKWTQTIFLKFYNSYYDEEAKKAKPIDDLIKKLKEQWKSAEEIK